MCLAATLLCSWAYAGDSKPQCAACAAKAKKAKKQLHQVVTGSRIPQASDRLGPIPSTASPVVIMSREDIDRTGRINPRGVLATQPFFH
jgi:hypothetical protein